MKYSIALSFIAVLAFVSICGCCCITGPHIVIPISAPEKSINVSWGYSVVPVNDGYAITGFTDPYNNHSIAIYLVKTDLNGNMVWNKTFRENYGDYGYDIINVYDGYVIAGQTYYYLGPSSIRLVKTDLNGNEIWSKTYDNGTSGSRIVLVKDGYVILGSISSQSNSGMYLMKVGPDGNMVWNRTYPINIVRDSIIALSDGFVIAGSKMNAGANRSTFLLKTDLNGTMIWNKTYEGLDNMGGPVAAVNDGYIIAGTVDLDPVGVGVADKRVIMLIKTDPSGNLVWNRTYFGTNGDNGKSVIAVSDGYIITGNTGSYENHTSYVYLVKTDLNGNILWNKTYGKGTGNSVISVNDGYIIVGETGSYGAGPSDVYLVKTDQNGNMVWNKTYGGHSK